MAVQEDTRSRGERSADAGARREPAGAAWEAAENRDWPPAATRLSVSHSLGVEFAAAAVDGALVGAEEWGRAPGAEAGERGWVFVPPSESPRGALFLVVEGAPAESAMRLDSAVRRALERDRGTPSSRLYRAVRDGCRQLEARAAHRFELAGVGLTALLVEEAYVYLAQLLPGQAFVLDDGTVQAVPPAPMRGAELVGSAAGRRWEMELEILRFAARPGATFVVCTSALGEAASAADVESCARLPVAEGVARLLPADTRRARGRMNGVVVRLTGHRPRTARARLLPIEAQRQSRTVGAPLPDRRRPAIEAWGIRREQRRVPLVGALLRQELYPARRRAGSAWWAIPVVALAIAGGGVWAARTGRIPVLRAPAPPVATPTAAAVETPPPATLAGTTVLEAPAGSLFRAMAVAGGAPRVLDSSGAVQLPAAGSGSGGAVPAVPAGGAVALVARDADVLAVDASRAIARLATQPDQQPEPVGLHNAALWQRPVGYATYGGNLYVLDAGTTGSPGQVWRHAGTAGGGFEGDAVPWVLPEVNVALDSATSIAVDGSIWVGLAGGGVLKLTAGRPDTFAVTGLEQPLQSAAALYTERGYSFVYVLDSAARRLVRLDKDGAAHGEVANVLAAGDTARGLWVDESGGTALVLTDRRLQRVSLPQ